MLFSVLSSSVNQSIFNHTHHSTEVYFEGLGVRRFARASGSGGSGKYFNINDTDFGSSTEYAHTGVVVDNEGGNDVTDYLRPYSTEAIFLIKF